MSKGKIKRVVITNKKFDPLVYGLEGIMDLFHVSKTTAHRYKNSIIRDAVYQQGNVIVTDTRKALELFGVQFPGRFVVIEEK